MVDANGNPTWQDYVDFWGMAQAANERKYQDTLTESRADRQARLTIANNQLRAERERNKIALGEAEANRLYREAQIELARNEAALNEKKFALSAELGRGELALSRERLGAETGLGLLQLRAGLRGPGDWAQFLDVGEGFDTVQPASGFLSAIAAGKRPGTPDVAFGGSPTPATLAGLATGPTGQQQARLSADMALAAQIAGNPGKAAPGSLNPGVIGQDRLEYLLGLAEKGGYSARTLMDAYDRAGIGQGNPWAY